MHAKKGMKRFIYVNGPGMGTNNRMTGIVAPGVKTVKQGVKSAKAWHKDHPHKTTNKKTK